MVRRWTVGILCVLLAVASTACGDDDGDDGAGPTTTTAAATTTATEASTTTVPATGEPGLVYFVRGEHLGVAGRDVPAGGDGLAAALRAVIEGPTATESAAGLSSAIPDGTAFHGVEVVDGLATVDVSAAFESGGGSLSMTLRVAQVVFTATEQPGVERVAFTLDGRPVDAIGGEGVMVDGVDRASFESALPPILVQRPTPGAQVTGTLEIAGLANVFEGTVSIEVKDPSGTTIVEGTGTGAMGEWRPFTAQLALPPGTTGPLVVYVFEASAKDGSELNVVDVDVMAG